MRRAQRFVGAPEAPGAGLPLKLEAGRGLLPQEEVPPGTASRISRSRTRSSHLQEVAPMVALDHLQPEAPLARHLLEEEGLGLVRVDVEKAARRVAAVAAIYQVASDVATSGPDGGATDDAKFETPTLV